MGKKEHRLLNGRARNSECVSNWLFPQPNHETQTSLWIDEKKNIDTGPKQVDEQEEDYKFV